MMTLGETLREVRLARGLSLKDAERVTTISHVRICQIEKSNSKTSEPILAKFAEAYNLNLAHLLNLNDSSYTVGEIQRLKAADTLTYKINLNALDSTDQQSYFKFSKLNKQAKLDLLYPLEDFKLNELTLNKLEERFLQLITGEFKSVLIRKLGV